MKKRNVLANKRPSATPDASFSAKRMSDERLKLVAGGTPQPGRINIGDGSGLAPPNEPLVLG